MKMCPPHLARECRYLSHPPELRHAPAAPPAPSADVVLRPLGSVRGYAALFDTRSEDLGLPGHSFYEIIQPGAFDHLDYSGVVALFNHDENHPLARTGAGLCLGVDARGLWYEFELPDTTLGRDLKELIHRSIISQSSFAFTVDEDGQDWHEHESSGTLTRTIHKISALYDVSLVTRPAYADTSVALRSLHDHKAQRGQQKLPLSARELAPALRAEVYALTGIPLPPPKA